jgi:hypothetical protein
MPTQAEIDNLQSNFGNLYKINVPGIAADANALKQLTSAPGTPNAYAIYTNPLSVGAPSPLTADLEQFDFGDVGEDYAIRDRSIEQNLDEATKYVQACASLRSDYIATAKLFLDTRLKSEEFFRLDNIHQQEVAAGLYNLPFDEASDDVSSLQNAISEAALQKSAIDAMYNAAASPPPKYAGALSDQQVKNYTDLSGQVADWSAIQNNPSIHQGTSQLTDYRSKIEDASWQYSLRANTTNTAELTGRLNTATRKQNYLRQDIGFRSARAAVSRQLAYVQLSENIRPNAPLNYSERLAAIRSLFDISLRKLIQRILPLNRGAKEIYGIDVPLQVPPRGQILDELGRWTLLIQDEIKKIHRRQRISIFTVWLSEKSLRSHVSFPDAVRHPGGSARFAARCGI